MGAEQKIPRLPQTQPSQWIAAHADHLFDAVVIGAGQSGLAAAYELKRRNLDFVVLDSNPIPGGAWQHRWDSLTMNDVHGVADLPGSVAPERSQERSNQIIPAYFAEYERDYELPVIRPVTVRRVEDDAPHLRVLTSVGVLRTRHIVNASGTWTRPFVPRYPGMETFLGEQFHTSAYPGAEHFRGKTVLVVGGGASAVQFLGELAHVTEDLLWATRRPPAWRDGDLDGLGAVTWVEQRAVAGEAPASVVSSTGLFLRPQEQYAASLGIYERRLDMFEALEPDGARWADGRFERLDAIIWATGFRPATVHLSPLHLKSPSGGIALERVPGDVQGATTAIADPRIHLVGYGPSASTVGARHAARRAAIAVKKAVGEPLGV